MLQRALETVLAERLRDTHPEEDDPFQQQQPDDLCDDVSSSKYDGDIYAADIVHVVDVASTSTLDVPWTAGLMWWEPSSVLEMDVLSKFLIDEIMP